MARGALWPNRWAAGGGASAAVRTCGPGDAAKDGPGLEWRAADDQLHNEPGAEDGGAQYPLEEEAVARVEGLDRNEVCAGRRQ